MWAWEHLLALPPGLSALPAPLSQPAPPNQSAISREVQWDGWVAWLG